MQRCYVYRWRREMWEAYIRPHTMGDNATSGQSKRIPRWEQILGHLLPEGNTRLPNHICISCLPQTPLYYIHVCNLTHNLINYCPKSKFISPGIRENENIQLGFYFNGSFLLSKWKSDFNQISISIR